MVTASSMLEFAYVKFRPPVYDESEFYSSILNYKYPSTISKL